MWLVCAVFASALWGLNYALAGRILTNISVPTLLAFEMLIGAIVFLIISSFFNIKNDLITLSTQPNLIYFIILEIIVVLLANLLITYSIQAKNASSAAMIELIYPLFTILFAWLIFKDNQFSFRIALSGSFIFAGLLLLPL